MIENLTIGKTYTLIEEIAPKNYKTAESINFTIDNNGTVVQKVVMYDELLPVAKKVKTGDDTPLLALEIASTMSIIAGAIIVIKTKKKEN